MIYTGSMKLKKKEWTTVRVEKEVLSEMRNLAKKEQRSVPVILGRAINLYQSVSTNR